jgi:hypothetical protein
MYVRDFLASFALSYPGPTPVLVDNMSLIYAIQSADVTRLKHVHVQLEFARQQVRIGAFKVSHVRSESNVADVFTKPLPLAAFNKHRSSLTVTLN